MTPEELSRAVVDVLASLVDDGCVALRDGAPTVVKVERPKVEAHGDYATNIALQLGKREGLAPRELAGLIAERLGKIEGIRSADVAGPGFINVRIDPAAQAAVVRSILAAGEAYGSRAKATGERINLEFVSANPTGPLTVGHTRWAAVGDTLARILSAAGAAVTREYYFNDHGAQIDRFAGSLLARARGREVAADGYVGSYIQEIADRITQAHPEVSDLPEGQALELLRREGVALMFTEIKASLHDFRVDFDVYFHENSLHESRAAERAIERLQGYGVMYEADGALWLRTTDFGDDKDRVVVKSDGQPAYISADLAYYLDKRTRGFDRCVILLGADHHGYVGRMMAMCAAFGDIPGENLEIIIGQMVNVVRDGHPLRMSRRAGHVITIEDLVEAIGVDAARYALARYSMDVTIDIDVDLWVRRTNDNPVYYVQYAHARMASILRNADDIGLTSTAEDFEPGLLDAPREGDLLRALAEYPRVVGQAAELREPHRIARYLEDTASSFHRFYDECRVLPLGDEEPTARHRARVLLVAASRQVLANGLRLLGVSAPERM